MPSAPSGAAKDAVNLPSLFIMILGGLGLLLWLGSLLGDLTGGSMRLTEALLDSLKTLEPEQQEQLRKLLRASSGDSKVTSIFWSLLLMGISGFTIWGGLQMRSLKNWGVALASAILVMIPCSDYCCCCLGIPVGIWALVMLTKPEVKSAFS